MIVITVELWRKGNPKDRVMLGTAVIVNQGTGTPWLGNYRAWFSKRGVRPEEYGLETRSSKTVRATEVLGFQRRRLLTWDLIFRALRAGFGGRNP